MRYPKNRLKRGVLKGKTERKRRKSELRKNKDNKTTWLNYKQLIRRKVLNHYCGGTPHCMATGCKVSCVEILELDHIFDNGGEHKREIGRGLQYLHWLIRNNFPAIIKVLCPNCHKARHAKVNWILCN